MIPFPIEEDLVLGIDLGIASCGSALVRLGEIPRIEFAGVRCFDPPEEPDPSNKKKRRTKNAARREHRGVRRVIRRRRQRMATIRRLLHDEGLLRSIDPDELKVRNSKHARNGTDPLCPWRSRADGLTRHLTRDEFAAALIHIAKHRGFQSNSKRDRAKNAPPDSKKMLAAIAKNVERVARYETVGAMFHEDSEFTIRKRNRPGDFRSLITRDLLRHEVGVLFERQRRLGNPLAGKALEQAFMKLAFSQRPIDDSDRMVGCCPFDPGEVRAAKHSYSFELFRYLSRLANLQLKSADGSLRSLRPEKIRALAQDFGRHQKSISFKTLRRGLGLRPEDRFEGIEAAKEDRDVTGASLGAAMGTHALRGVFGEAGWRALIERPAVLDQIAHILAFRDDVGRIEAGLNDLGLEPLHLRTLMAEVREGKFAEFRGTGHISAKAARRLIPHLLNGHKYSDACMLAGYDHTAAREVKLEDINSSVVRRALREALAQIKTLIHEFGVRPGRIHVELARDIGKGPEERLAITDGMERRRIEKDKLRDEFTEKVGVPPSSDEELLRFELWKEQGGHCIYTNDPTRSYIRLEDLLDASHLVQVDHVLPRSRGGESTFINRVLCLSSANQNKGHRTPWEWKVRDEKDDAWWRWFGAKVEPLHVKGRKKRNLLMRDFAEREQVFAERNLTDTRYASRALLAELGKLYPEGDGERRLFARPGAITGLLRRAWGLDGRKFDEEGNRRPDDRTHALDAIVIACTTEGQLQRLTRIYQQQEDESRHRLSPHVPEPWAGFREQILAAVDAVLVSRSERRRGRGEAHEATIRRLREEDGERIVYERKAIMGLNASDLGRIKDADCNRTLVGSLRKWLEAGKPKDEDSLPRSPKGDVIRRVYLRTSKKAGVDIRDGYADNGGMVRADVFARGGKYYLVPVYVHQVADREDFPNPPNRAVVAHKAEEEWTSIDDTYEFLFSAHLNSYVEAVKGDGEVIAGYYRGLDRNGGQIAISPHFTQDERYERGGIGTRLLQAFRKYSVDRLGRKHEIVQERRTWHGAVCT